MIPAKWYAVLIQEWLEKHSQKPQSQPTPPGPIETAKPTVADGSKELEIKNTKGDMVLATFSIAPDGQQGLLKPRITVPLTDPAYTGFLQARVLEPLKRLRGFNINIFEEENRLVAISFKGSLDENHVKEITGAVRWTFERVLERKSQ